MPPVSRKINDCAFGSDVTLRYWFVVRLSVGAKDYRFTPCRYVAELWGCAAQENSEIWENPSRLALYWNPSRCVYQGLHWCVRVSISLRLRSVATFQEFVRVPTLPTCCWQRLGKRKTVSLFLINGFSMRIPSCIVHEPRMKFALTTSLWVCMLSLLSPCSIWLHTKQPCTFVHSVHNPWQ